MIVFFHPKSQSYFDKYGIAGILCSFYKILRTMSSPVCTVDPSVIDQLVSGTVETILHSYSPFLKTCCHCDDLECRTRFIGIIQTGIPPHLIQQFLLLLCTQAESIRICIQFKRVIQIKFRHIYTGIDFSVLRVHQKNRNSFSIFFFHNLQSSLLDIFLYADIQTGSKRAACLGFFPVFSDSIQFDSPRISSREDFARITAQHIFIFHLKAYDSLVVCSCKSQDSGSKRIPWIISLVVFIHLYPRKTGLSYFISHLFFYICPHSLYGGYFFYFFSHCIF